MNTATSFFYLSPETEYELHGESYCSCPQPQSQSHTVVGAYLYELDVPGLQALDTALLGGNETSFEKWIENHPATIYYGPDKQTAIVEAVIQARKERKLIINHPEAYPWMFPLITTLAGVVGDGLLDGCLPEDVCQCNELHAAEKTVCRACYARLVSKVVHTFMFAYLRQSESASQGKAELVADEELKEFEAIAKERGMIVKVLDGSHILVGYQGRWEIFTKVNDGQYPLHHVVHMLCSAHWVEPYLPDNLVLYAEELYEDKNLATIWEEWLLDQSYYSKFKHLLGGDFDLFVEIAIEI
jgi:hypothetical protein